jgi:hypothetical protein
VLVASHGDVCHQLSLAEGLDPYENPTERRNMVDFLEFVAKKGYYTVSVTATDDCYYSIQVTELLRGLIKLTEGHSFPTLLNATSKQYFLVENKVRSTLKVISSIAKDKMGELIIRAMPVRDEQME